MNEDEKAWWLERMTLRREQMKKDLEAAKIEYEKHTQKLVEQAKENQ